MNELTLTRDLNDDRVKLIKNEELQGLVADYLGAKKLGEKYKWTEYETFTAAVAKMSLETVKDATGKRVPKYTKKKDFYEFLGEDDSKGNNIISVIAWVNSTENMFQDYTYVDDKIEYLTEVNDKGETVPKWVTLKEMGFTVSKCVILMRLKGNIVNLLTYIKDIDNDCDGVKFLLNYSDKALKDVIKQWTENGCPAHAPSMKEAKKQEAEKQEAKKQEAEKQEAKKQEAKKQEAEKQEAEKQETEKQETEKQEAEKQEAEKQETEKQELDPREVVAYIKANTSTDNRKLVLSYLLNDWGIISAKIDRKGNISIVNK